jgi:hypothetical protein
MSSAKLLQTMFGRTIFFMSIGSSLARLVVLPVVLCVGCVHRPLPIKATYTLEEVSQYALLAPSVAPKAVDGEFQTSLVTLPGITLPGKKRIADSSSILKCSIKGSVFFFRPDDSPLMDQWLITSPSVQGWEKLGGEIDLPAEWSGFTHDLLLREGLGCFPAGDSLPDITRAIVEKMPIPASEALLFFYSFGGTGFADLVPGMQIKIERTLLESPDKRHVASRYRGSLDAQYKVVPVAGGGVALRLSNSKNRKWEGSPGSDGELIFGLSTRFATKPKLRLFLESVRDDNTQRLPILIGADNSSDIDTVTRQIEAKRAAGCPAGSSAAVECVAFNKENAVSLLSSIWVNGQLLYRPPGTTLGYIVETLLKTDEQARAFETLSLKRPLITGGYAEVTFPKTLANAQQIILLSGDRIAWKR